MSTRNTVFNYGWVAKTFHWVIGLAIIFMLWFGLHIDGMEASQQKLEYIGWHKSIGIAILAIAVLRYLWRQVNIVPALPGDMGLLLRFLAHCSHYALYFMIFFMPLIGWLMSSAAGYPVSVFGLYTLPNLVPVDKAQSKFYFTLHEYGGYLLIGLVTLHVLAGLYHLIVRRDRVFTRMLPWGKGA